MSHAARCRSRHVTDWPIENDILSASASLMCLSQSLPISLSPALNLLQKSGQRMKCSACQLVAHHNCIPLVNEKTQLACKPTYRDVGIRQYREQTTTHHHWVHRKLEKGKCKQCGKVIIHNDILTFAHTR